MPSSRLSDGQRAEMVERFRQGVATVTLADAYGCSPNTVSRLVKAAMDGAEYERLKRQRQRGFSASEPTEPSELTEPRELEDAQQSELATAQAPEVHQAAAAVEPPTGLAPLLGSNSQASEPPQSQQPALPGLLEATAETPADAVEPAASELVPGSVEPPVSPPPPTAPPHLAADSSPANHEPEQESERPEDPSPHPRPSAAQPEDTVAVTRSSRGLALEEPQDAEPGVLAIEDADDFSDDDLGDDDSEFSDESLPLDEVFLPVPLLEIGVEVSPAGALAWGSASLPSSAYMLVEKTVELQPQMLRELPELSHLPEEEQERQALVLYVNPRQAKRQCGRHQRVIRIPDTQVFELTAPKLAAQGITRVVVEGSLFALPGC